MREIDTFTTEFTLPISPKIRLKMLTVEYGQQISPRSEWGQVDYASNILGGLNYIYNVLTGYHYKAPHGMDVPKGKHFNPYFDHMIIGMPR